MNKICNEYCSMINKKYGSIVKSIIIYGSNIYNPSNSDLDICLIVDKCSQKTKDSIIKSTIKFHNNHDLKIDEEVPFCNKLIYTYEDIDNTLANPPFYKNNSIIINKIVKTKEFLSSLEMKQRLLLNILTTDHITIGQSTTKFEDSAFKIIINTIIRYYNLKDPTVEQILQCMYVNQYDGSKGEMYLGYKNSNKKKEKYLINKLKEYIND